MQRNIHLAVRRLSHAVFTASTYASSFQTTWRFVAYGAALISFIQLASMNITWNASFQKDGIDFYAYEVLKWSTLHRIPEYYISTLDYKIYATVGINLGITLTLAILAFTLTSRRNNKLVERTLGFILGVYQQFFEYICFVPNLDLYFQGIISGAASPPAFGLSIAFIAWPIIFMVFTENRYSLNTSYSSNNAWSERKGSMRFIKLLIKIVVIIVSRILQRFDQNPLSVFLINIGASAVLFLFFLHKQNHDDPTMSNIVAWGYSLYIVYSGFVYTKSAAPQNTEVVYIAIILLAVVGCALQKLLQLRIHSLFYATDYMTLSCDNLDWLLHQIQRTLLKAERGDIPAQNKLMLFIENFIKQPLLHDDSILGTVNSFDELKQKFQINSSLMKKENFIFNLQQLAHNSISILYSQKLKTCRSQSYNQLALSYIYFLIQHKSSSLIRAAQLISNIYHNHQTSKSKISLSEKFCLHQVKQVLGDEIVNQLNSNEVKALEITAPLDYEDLHRTTRLNLEEILVKYEEFYSLMNGKTLDLDVLMSKGKALQTIKSKFEPDIIRLLNLNPYSRDSHFLYKFYIQYELGNPSILAYHLFEKLMLEHHSKGVRVIDEDIEQGIVNIFAHDGGVAIMSIDEKHVGKILRMTTKFVRMFGYQEREHKALVLEALMPVVLANVHNAVVQANIRSPQFQAGISKVTAIDKKGFLLPMEHLIKIIPYQNELCAAAFLSPSNYEGSILLIDPMGYLLHYTKEFHAVVCSGANIDERPLYGLNLGSVAPFLLAELYSPGVTQNAGLSPQNLASNERTLPNERKRGFMLLPKLPENLQLYENVLKKVLKIHQKLTQTQNKSHLTEDEHIQLVVSTAQSFLESPNLRLLQLEYQISEFKVSSQAEPIGYYLQIYETIEIDDQQVITSETENHASFFNALAKDIDWDRQISFKSALSSRIMKLSLANNMFPTPTYPKNGSRFSADMGASFSRIDFTVDRKELNSVGNLTERMNTIDHLLTNIEYTARTARDGEESLEISQRGEESKQFLLKKLSHRKENDAYPKNPQRVLDKEQSLFSLNSQPRRQISSIIMTQREHVPQNNTIKEVDEVEELLAHIPNDALVNEFTKRGYSVSFHGQTPESLGQKDVERSGGYSHHLMMKKSEQPMTNRIIISGDQEANIDIKDSLSEEPDKLDKPKARIPFCVSEDQLRQVQRESQKSLNNKSNKQEEEFHLESLEGMDHSTRKSSLSSKSAKTAAIYQQLINSEENPNHLRSIQLFGLLGFCVMGMIMSGLFATLYSLLTKYIIFVDIADYTCPFTGGMSYFLYNTEKIIMQNKGIFDIAQLNASYMFSYAALLNEQAYNLLREKYANTMAVIDLEGLSGHVQYSDYRIEITQKGPNDALEVQLMEYFGAVERLQGIMYDYMRANYSTINETNKWAIYFRENYDKYFFALTQVTAILFQELYGTNQTVDVQHFSRITMSVNLCIMLVFFLTLYPIYRRNENKIIQMLALFGTYTSSEIDMMIQKMRSAILIFHSSQDNAAIDQHKFNRVATTHFMKKGTTINSKKDSNRAKRTYSDWKKERYSICRFILIEFLVFGIGASYVIGSSIVTIDKNKRFLPILSEYDLSTDSYSFNPTAFAVTLNILGRYPEATSQTKLEAIVARHGQVYERLLQRKANIMQHFGENYDAFLKEAYLQDSYQQYIERLRRADLCDLLEGQDDITPTNVTECKGLLKEVSRLGLAQVVVEIFDKTAQYREEAQKNGLTLETVKALVNTQEFYELDRLTFYADRVLRDWGIRQRANLTACLNDQIDHGIVVFVIGIVLLGVFFVVFWMNFMKRMRTQFFAAKKLYALLPCSMIIHNNYIRKCLRDLSRIRY